jgi:lipopolysaccharide heptosyltransferase I
MSIWGNCAACVIAFVLCDFDIRAYYSCPMPDSRPINRLDDFNAQRICLIKPSALGDIVQTLPLLGILRQRYPTATVSWVIRRDLADLITGHPDLAEIIPYHRDGSLLQLWSLLALLRHRRFDLVFDLQGLLRTAFMTLATGAPLRVGLETAREGSWLACNAILPESGRDVPAHRRYWRVAEALGLGHLMPATFVPTTATDENWLADQLRRLPRPVMAIHPGARWVTKRWPIEKFTEIARRFPGSVVVVGTPGEQLAGTRIAEAVTRERRPALNLAGQTTLKQLACLLRSADLMVSNDSGPMHLAAGLGTPVVGIFTCTSPVISGPAGTQHELVSTSVACAAGYHKTCPQRGTGHLACLGDLSIERVWNAVERILGRSRSAAC